MEISISIDQISSVKVRGLQNEQTSEVTFNGQTFEEWPDFIIIEGRKFVCQNWDEDEYDESDVPGTFNVWAEYDLVEKQ